MVIIAQIITDFCFLFQKTVGCLQKKGWHAIVEGEDSKVYRFGDFTSTNLFKDSFQAKDYLIIGNENFIVSFELNEAQNALE